MAALKKILLLVLLLSLPLSSAIPSLPTLIYGKVFGAEGTYLPDVEVKASFFTEDGQERTIHALTDTTGNYYFTKGYILAKPGSLITITAGKAQATVLGNPGTTIQAKMLVLETVPPPLTPEQKEEIKQSTTPGAGSNKGTDRRTGSGSGGSGGSTGDGTGEGSGQGKGGEGTGTGTGEGSGNEGDYEGTGTADPHNYTKLSKLAMEDLKQRFREGKPLDNTAGTTEGEGESGTLSSLVQRILKSISGNTKPTTIKEGTSKSTVSSNNQNKQTGEDIHIDENVGTSNTTQNLATGPQNNQEEISPEKTQTDLAEKLELYFFSEGKPRYDRMLAPFIGAIAIIILITFIAYRSINPRLRMMKEHLAIKELRKRIMKILNVSLEEIMVEHIITIEPSTTTPQIMSIFTTNNAGSILVTEGSRLKGIITERDILSRIEDKNLPKFRAEDIMTKEVITATPKMRLGEAGLLMIKHNIRKLPIIKNQKLTGILTMTDILKIYDNFFSQHEFESENIPSVQSCMSMDYIHAQTNEYLLDALKSLITKKANAILAMHKTAVLGIITERDILAEYSINPNFLQNTTIQALMKTTVINVQQYTTIIEANRIMIENNIRRLPVMQGDEAVGFISQTDLLEAFCLFCSFISSEEGKKALSVIAD
ncbi:MAG: CBS domain-containing protein [Nanoarchaeota archaeon]